MNDTVFQPTYAFEGFRLDAQHRVLSRADGQPIPLAPKVFDTLLYFVERPGQLIAKRELLEAIWPHVVVEENNLTQAISALRRILGETPGAHRFIATEPGRGYRLVASVRTISRSTDELSAAPEAATPISDGETRAARAPLTPRGRSGWRGIGITAGRVIGYRRHGGLVRRGTGCRSGLSAGHALYDPLARVRRQYLEPLRTSSRRVA
jgi:serine/threonine-protein kinase